LATAGDETAGVEAAADFGRLQQPAPAAARVLRQQHFWPQQEEVWPSPADDEEAVWTPASQQQSARGGTKPPSSIANAVAGAMHRDFNRINRMLVVRRYQNRLGLFGRAKPPSEAEHRKPQPKGGTARFSALAKRKSSKFLRRETE
jgi:hypothetical protein